MKKIVLFASAILAGSVAMAQSEAPVAMYGTGAEGYTLSNAGVAAKGTAVGKDTLRYRSAAQASGPYSIYPFEKAAPLDSNGYLFGMNLGGFKGWAQLYHASTDIDITGNHDTTLQVIGLMTAFHGTRSLSSTKSITLNIWKRNTTKVAWAARTKWYFYGLPQASAVASKTVNFPAIKIDSLQAHYFATPLSAVDYDFYAGYTTNYTWGSLGGDTIGLIGTQTALTNIYSVEPGTLDTLLGVNIITMNSSNVWKATAFELGFSSGDQMIYPLVKLTCPTCGVGVKSFSQNNLSFFGNYPNPAVNSTRIKVGLKTNADVTVQILDAAGRTVQTIEKKGLSIGEHMIDVNTSAMPAGTYAYLVSTSAGDGIASQMTVVK